MAYPDFGNPREVRSFMEADYARYKRGEQLFPRVRVSDPEGLPRKSKQIGATLARAWGRIDEDRSYFGDALKTMIDDRTEAGPQAGTGAVIVRVGRNAVNFAFIQTGQDQKLTVAHGVQEIGSFLEQIADNPLRVGDEPLRYVNGWLDLSPFHTELGVVRTSNASVLLRPQSAAPVHEQNMN